MLPRSYFIYYNLISPKQPDITSIRFRNSGLSTAILSTAYSISG